MNRFPATFDRQMRCSNSQLAPVAAVGAAATCGFCAGAGCLCVANVCKDILQDVFLLMLC